MEAAYHSKNSAMEAENHVKYGASSKSQMSGGNFRKSCFAFFMAGVILLLFTLCSTTATAQAQISFEELMKQAQTLHSKIGESFKEKDNQTGEKLSLEAIALYNQLSKESQETYKWFQAANYYNLACIYSLQNQKEKAIDAFEKTVNEYEYVNYSHANTDTDLDNIRTDQRFIALMESIREKGDYVYILRQSGKYQSADTTGLPRFTYEAATSNNLRNVKGFFKLDSIAGQGDEISKILHLLKWVQTNIRHDGSNYALCEFTSIDIYNYHKSTGKEVNCRHLAFVLNEMYLAMGFKSRYVTCMPKDDGTDAHVINSVYSTTLKKWLWVDPTFNAYWKDENGNLLSIEEVRERLINDRPLILNDDANWNNQAQYTKEMYLDGWMSKYLYWFSCATDSRFNSESRYRNTNQTYICLVPWGYEPHPSNVETVITHDAAYFWEN